MVELLRAPISSSQAPDLDEAQRAVVAHERGPMLVLAGPGTGKTTTLVEAMVAKLRGTDATRQLHPDRVLALTFGRNAAQELRDRVAARLGGGILPTVTTFHSFCYALVHRLADHDAYLHPPRLITAPEQDRRVRELLIGSVRDGRLVWPEELRAAIGTNGLAAEVRAVIARARGLQLDGPDLVRIGHSEHQPSWIAIGEFLGEYLDVLDAEGVLDYSELIHRASELIDVSAGDSPIRSQYDAVFVDEYQDTDPAQVRLLKRLVRPDTCFVAVGDPDQAIYGFRGADVGGILRFSADFRRADGAPPEITVINRNRRFGPVIGEVASRIVRRVPLGSLPREIQSRHRTPECVGPAIGDVTVLTYESQAAQAMGISDKIRRLKLSATEVDLAWSDIAILVRSGVSDIASLQRALESAGIPVDVAGDEIPLRSEPIVQPLLDVLRVAAEPSALTTDRAQSLLASPLGGMDGRDQRRLGRGLRAAARQAGLVPVTSAELIRQALAQPNMLLELPSDITDGPRRVASLLAQARSGVEQGDDVEQILWQVWAATSWPERLRRTALGGGLASRTAHHDLDAVVALFETAARADAVFEGHRGVVDFLAELDQQAIPGTTLAQAAAGRDAVQLMTAHRSKGLEWPVVVIAGVQEGQWPDLRRRGSLLRAELLGTDGLELPATVSDLLAQERRLFYVACTRARRSLIVTAVQRAESDSAPSRFVDEVSAAGAPRIHVAGFPAQRLTLGSIVATLRHMIEDPATDDSARQAAAARLATLAVVGDFAEAKPENWWGIRPPTRSEAPVRDPLLPLKVSGTAWQGIAECSLRWFLGREARGENQRSAAVAFGSVVHAIADAVGRGELPPDPTELTAKLQQVWPALPHETAWIASAELEAAATAVERFANWHLADVLPGRDDRTLVGTEVPFDVELAIGADLVRARGSADRVEVDGAGSIHVVDLKTSKSKPAASEVAEHQQLALYQVAAAAGAFDAELGVRTLAPELGADAAGSDRPKVAGAELVQLRVPGRSAGWPRVQPQQAVDIEDQLARLAQAVAIVRAEDFAAIKGARCRSCDFASLCPVTPQGREVT